MLSYFVFVDFDAESRARIRAHDSAGFFDSEAFADDIAAPWNIAMHGFTDDVARRCESEFQGRGRAYRPLGVVRGHRDTIRLGHRGDAPRFGQSAAMGDVGLN